MACGSCGQRYRPQQNRVVGGRRFRRVVVQNAKPAVKVSAGKNSPENVPYDHVPVEVPDLLPKKNPSTGHAESVITTGVQGPEIKPNSTGIDTPDAGSSAQVEFDIPANPTQGEG